MNLSPKGSWWRASVGLVAGALALAGVATGAHAACVGCATFGSGTNLGRQDFDQLDEASGLAVSTKNPGIVWSHNDEEDQDADFRIFAFQTNGTSVARYRIRNMPHVDVEDMAVGPGPTAGVQYIYLADIGGDVSFGGRTTVRIFRFPEPTVIPSDSNIDVANHEIFTLMYPVLPGYNYRPFWDAETMFVDPRNSDVYVGSKSGGACWLYRANLNSFLSGSTNEMEYVTTIPFSDASGGAMSADGTQIALRNESVAQIWIRCDTDTVSNALSRSGQYIPVIGEPTEPNGEAIAFLPNGRGYFTISDKLPGGASVRAPLYFFPATCAPTVISQQPQSQQVPAGTDVEFAVQATGENLHYQWRFNGSDLGGQTSSLLALTGVAPGAAGQYSVRVAGNGGTVTSTVATLGVQILPPVIFQPPVSLVYAPTGGIVQLNVGVNGTAPFRYDWVFGRRRLTNNFATLTLTNVTRKQSGKYRVTVTNSTGKVVSPYATVSVQNPPVIKTQPLSRTNAVGSRASLRVRATGSPSLKYQWYFEGNAISNATRSTLSFRRVGLTNAGTYSVRVTNRVGTNFSAPVQLTVP